MKTRPLLYIYFQLLYTFNFQLFFCYLEIIDFRATSRWSYFMVSCHLEQLFYCFRFSSGEPFFIVEIYFATDVRLQLFMWLIFFVLLIFILSAKYLQSTFYLEMGSLVANIEINRPSAIRCLPRKLVMRHWEVVEHKIDNFEHFIHIYCAPADLDRLCISVITLYYFLFEN